MKNIRIFLSENFHFLVVKYSVYLNRHVFRNELLVSHHRYTEISEKSSAQDEKQL